jgi:hypothetical protein
MLLNSRFCLLAKRLSQLNVVCWLKRLPSIPLFRERAMLVVQSSCFPIHSPPSLSTPTTCQSAFVLVGSGVQVRSGCWGSIGSVFGVSLGGGALGTLCMSRSLIYSLLMAIQVHLLESTHDGSGRSKPANGRILSGNSSSFINIGSYCWSWASSRFSLHNFIVQTKHLLCFRRVLTIFEKCFVFRQISMML